MKANWIAIAATAAVLGLAGMTGSALAANTASCDGCHGANGQGKAPNPKIAGMSAAAFTAAMNAYKSGAKKHPAMNAMAKNLSAADIASLAAYYASK
jgi:cytochrome c553